MLTKNLHVALRVGISGAVPSLPDMTSRRGQEQLCLYLYISQFNNRCTDFDQISYKRSLLVRCSCLTAFVRKDHSFIIIVQFRPVFHQAFRRCSQQTAVAFHIHFVVSSSFQQNLLGSLTHIVTHYLQRIQRNFCKRQYYTDYRHFCSILLISSSCSVHCEMRPLYNEQENMSK